MSFRLYKINLIMHIFVNVIRQNITQILLADNNNSRKITIISKDAEAIITFVTII